MRYFTTLRNAVQVQKFLGHHSPAFTLAVYVHLLPDDLPDPAFLDEIASSPTGSGEVQTVGAIRPIYAQE